MRIVQKSSLFITLLTSSATLLCCALPALLVLLGAGSTVAAVVGIFPQLIWLSEHKSGLFLVGAVLLVLSRYLSRFRAASCPIDPVMAEQCKRTKQWTNIVWRISVGLYLAGFIGAYILVLFI